MRLSETTGQDDGGTGPIRPGGGESVAALQRWAATGEITHIAGDVFLPTDMLPRMPQRVAALAALVPPHATVARAAAAWVWGGPLPPSVEVVIPPGASRRMPPGVTAHQDTRLPQDQVHRFETGPLTVTTPARTALDLLGAGVPAAEPALAWLRRTLVDDAEILALLDLRYRYPGTRELRARVSAALASSPPDSGRPSSP